jgi:hypothetical protein
VKGSEKIAKQAITNALPQQQKDNAAKNVLKQEGGHDLFKDFGNSVFNGARSFAGNAKKTGTALFNGVSNFLMPSAAAAEGPSNQAQNNVVAQQFGPYLPNKQPSQQQPASPSANPGQTLTPEEKQKRLAKIATAVEQRENIDQLLPSGKVDVGVSVKENGYAGLSGAKDSLRSQWLKAAKGQLGGGDENGLNNYTKGAFESVENSIAGGSRKGYLEPTKNPTDKVALIGLKKDALKDLVQDLPGKGQGVLSAINSSGEDQLVRSVTKTDALGKPTTEYSVKVRDSFTGEYFGSWIKVKAPTDEQRIVSVDVTDITQGKKPTSLKSTVNISGGEQETGKQLRSKTQGFEGYTNPTFLSYQQLKSQPRKLSGSELRNEIGMTLGSPAPGRFLPGYEPNNSANIEKEGSPENKAFKAGKLDLFSANASPEMLKGLTPEDQNRMQEHRKQLWGKITRVEGLIRGFGGDNAKVTSMPVLVTSAGQKDEQQHGLFRVERPDGQTRFVDSTGRIYEDMKDWRDNNQLPVGTMTYFKDGKINDAKDAKPNLVTEKTRTGFREGMEKLDGLGTATGIAGGALTLTVEGAVVGLPMMFGSMLYGGARTLGSMADRAKHGQSNTDMSDPEVRGNTIGLAATALSVFPLGSAMKLGKAGLELKALSPAMQKVAVASQYVDTLAVLNSGVTLQQNWGNLTPEQKLQAGAQIGFWGLMTGVSAKQSGSLYGFNLNKKGQPQGKGASTDTESPSTIKQGAETNTEVPSPQAQLKQQETIANLKQGYAGKDGGGHNFAPSGGDRVDINGQIKIHPDKLVELQADSVAFGKLLKGTKALEEQGGDFSKLSKENQDILTSLSGSNPKTGGKRLRFEYQIKQQVDGYLDGLKVKDKKIFQNMSDDERARVFDLLNERRPVKDKAQQNAKDLEEHQAADYSLSQNPKSASEFVEQFQMYKAVLDGAKNKRLNDYQSSAEHISKSKYGKGTKELSEKELKIVQQEATREVFGREIEGDKAIKREAYIDTVNRSGTSDNPEKVNSNTQESVQEQYKSNVDAFKKRIGSRKIDPNLSQIETDKQVILLNQKGEIRFQTEAAAAYHVEKHYENEFPLSERRQPGTNVDRYILGASETINKPDKVSHGVDQAGNRTIVFERKIMGDDGKILNGRAIVKVSPNGDVGLATYHVPGEWKE